MYRRYFDLEHLMIVAVRQLQFQTAGFLKQVRIILQQFACIADRRFFRLGMIGIFKTRIIRFRFLSFNMKKITRQIANL